MKCVDVTVKISTKLGRIGMMKGSWKEEELMRKMQIKVEDEVHHEKDVDGEIEVGSIQGKVELKEIEKEIEIEGTEADLEIKFHEQKKKKVKLSRISLVEIKVVRRQVMGELSKLNKVETLIFCNKR